MKDFISQFDTAYTGSTPSIFAGQLRKGPVLTKCIRKAPTMIYPNILSVMIQLDTEFNENFQDQFLRVLRPVKSAQGDARIFAAVY